MIDKKKNLEEKKQEENTEEEMTIQERIEHLEKQLAIAQQQIELYQEIEKLSIDEIFRHYLLKIMQQQNELMKENNEVLKGIGNNLVEIGNVLDEKLIQSIPRKVVKPIKQEEYEEE